MGDAIAPRQRWQRRTLAGRIVCRLGSIRLAVPIMVLVALALAWATFIESSSGAAAARSAVYGTWWFIGLMALVCVTLIAAVASRYPWRRSHVGFIVVHASLVLLIVSGFVSMFTRVEGQIRLTEGQGAGAIETEGVVLSMTSLETNDPGTVAEVRLDRISRQFRLGPLNASVERFFPNVRVEASVIDGGPEPFEAFRVAVESAGSNPTPGHADDASVWMGQTGRFGDPHELSDMEFQVLRADEPWPGPDASGGREYFDIDGRQFALVPPRTPVYDGWWIVSIERFEHALVGEVGLEEGPPELRNPATQVVITDGRDSFERHILLHSAADRPFTQRISGEAESGARLRSVPRAQGASVVLQRRADGVLRVAYSPAPGADAVVVERNDAGPWIVGVGERQLRIEEHLTRAQQVRQLVPAPTGNGTALPGAVVRIGGDTTRLIELPWRQPTLVRSGGRTTPSSSARAGSICPWPSTSATSARSIIRASRSRWPTSPT